MAGLLQDGLISIAKGELHGDVKKTWEDWEKPPGTIEGLIPVWGPGREALADFRAGDYVGGGVNTALAISDLGIVTALGRGMARGAFKYWGAPTWRSAREWMQEAGHIKPGEQGHHWFLSQNEGIFSRYFPELSKTVPERVKNQMYNVMSLPKDIHMRLHHIWDKKKRYNSLQHFWYGTPKWFKETIFSTTGRAVEPLLPEYPDHRAVEPLLSEHPDDHAVNSSASGHFEQSTGQTKY